MTASNLSKEQIRELVKFINARGFTDDVVVLEILDHFARKVEEVIDSDPGISLEGAMTKAHASFGYAGFAPIAGKYGRRVRKKYRRIFWQRFGYVVSQPGIFLLLPLVAFCVFQGYLYLFKNVETEWLGIFDITSVCFLSIILLTSLPDLVLRLNVPKADRQHPFVVAAFVNGVLSSIIFMIIFSGMSHSGHQQLQNMVAGIIALYVCFIIPRHIATRRTLKVALRELQELRGLGSY